METSDSIVEITKALNKVQAALRPAPQEGLNPHFRSKYSSLKSIWDTIREPVTENGICVLQDVTNYDRGICVTTRLQHVSGEWITFGPLCIPMTKQDAHGAGSAASYAKRYGLTAALGVVSGEEDDDGNGAVNNTGINIDQQHTLLGLIKDHQDIQQKLSTRFPKGINTIPLTSYQSVLDWVTTKLDEEANK